MKFQYLITVVKKSDDEIKNLVKKLNLRGDILVGNQMMEVDTEYEMSCFGCSIKVFNMSNAGVSKNRNFLLRHSEAEYVTFLDDDMHCVKGLQEKMEALVSASKYNGVRFNVISDNFERPIKQLKKEGYVGFHKLTSYGVWGVFFKREFLIDNNLFFNESVGPGTTINHGEDTLFNKHFFKKSKIYCFSLAAFHAAQIDSTWYTKKRDLKTELFAHGYVYYLLYKHHSNIRSILFLMTHMHCYPKGTKYGLLRKYMKNGIKKAKEIYR